MQDARERNLFVCYVSRLDLRWIVLDVTPFLSLFDTYPWVRITNFPSNELHTENARHKIGAILSSLAHGRLLTFADIAKYHVHLDDPRYGDVFFVLDTGYMFCPHDFYHPIANVFFAFTDSMQRSRLRDPRHRANHGYLPDSDAEQAFAILLDRSRQATVREGELIDLARSFLECMGRTPPESMKGRRVFGG